MSLRRFFQGRKTFDISGVVCYYDRAKNGFFTPSDTLSLYRRGISERKNAMTEPVSVLMSVYYRETPAFLTEALDSILINQTRAPAEFVLVCDGPLTPELDAVIAGYQSRFPEILKVCRLETNQGLGEALRFGLTRCTCDLVARADSDDLWVPDRLETQIRFMEAHPEISISGGYIDEFREDPGQPFRLRTVPLLPRDTAKMLKSRCPMNHTTVIFRRMDVEEVGSYRKIADEEDYDLWIRAVAHGKKLGNLDRVLVHVRVGNGMAGRRGNRARIESWRVMNAYMLRHGMINRLEYWRNMAAVRLFIYMPSWGREFLYRTILRRRTGNPQGQTDDSRRHTGGGASV